MLIKQKKELANLKISHMKFESMEKQQKKNENKESLWDLCDIIKQSNICILQFKRRRERGAEGLSKEIMAEDSPNLRKEMAYKFQTLNEFQLV